MKEFNFCKNGHYRKSTFSIFSNTFLSYCISDSLSIIDQRPLLRFKLALKVYFVDFTAVIGILAL